MRGQINGGGYTRERSQELITHKENMNLKLLVDDEGQLLAIPACNSLPVDRSYHHFYVIWSQNKTSRSQAYSTTDVISHILSTCQLCNLWKNNKVIDNEIISKITMTLADNIKKKYKNVRWKTKHIQTLLLSLTVYQQMQSISQIITMMKVWRGCSWIPVNIPVWSKME